jgi:hypothetical protein
MNAARENTQATNTRSWTCMVSNFVTALCSLFSYIYTKLQEQQARKIYELQTLRLLYEARCNILMQ